MHRIDRSATVARIVTDHSATASVFQKHGIDFCCRGNVTVDAACRERRLDADALFAELEGALEAAAPDAAGDPRDLSTAALVARIVDRHHAYLRGALPYVATIAAKVAAVHGPKDARLAELHAVFGDLAESLLPHLDEEETVLFPALLSRTPDERVVRRELDRMQDDHLAVGDLLARLRALTDGYATPAWGCRTYRLLMTELEAIEADILRHVHLENHVLAPRFAAAEVARAPAA